MQVALDKLVLSSGREIRINGYIGITVNGSFDLAQGYDTQFFLDGDPNDPQERELWPLTPEERAEIADLMIARWQAFKEGKDQ